MKAGLSASSRRRGYDKERELVRKLWEAGFATMRAPASGSKAKRVVQPDIVAAKDGRIFALEVKARRRAPIYIERAQVEKLLEWARRAGGEALIAIYVDRRWLLVRASEAMLGSSANVKIGEEELRRAVELRDFISGASELRA